MSKKKKAPAYNYNNGDCVQCGSFVYKGDGFWLWHNGTNRIFCAPCGIARMENRKKAAATNAYVAKQPTLFEDSKPMTDKQIKFIRDLFKQIRSAMTIDEQQNLINKMTAHISGEVIQTSEWASRAIDKLKSIKQKGAK